MKIERSAYSGYLWYSDQTKPQVLYNENFELEIPESKNPFIVEGQLADDNISISIKFVDGRYIVKTYDLAAYDEVETEFEEYVPNRMDKVEKLLFKRAWKPVEDKLCCNMYVLQPAELVFVGLKMKEDKK